MHKNAIQIKQDCQKRATKAKRVLALFYDKNDMETSLIDCMADLLHLSEAEGYDWDNCCGLAISHFTAEMMGK